MNGQFETKIREIGYVENKEPELLTDRQDGRRIRRKSVGDDKLSSGTIVADNSITQAKMADNAIGQAELKYELVTVNIDAGQTSGTGTATSGSIIIGFRSAGNVDQLVDNIAISGTTVTITLAAAATAQNNFIVILLKT